MSRPAQSFANHARMVPLYHYVTSPLILVLMGWQVYRLVDGPSLDRLFTLLLLLALALTAYFARTFALGVQDRLIRLEERLRLDLILPDDLRSRIPELSVRQLIALRFASDEELPELARRVLDEGIQDSKAIKRAVRAWRADHQRI